MPKSIGRLLKDAYYTLNKDLDNVSRPYGLTATQMILIDFLSLSKVAVSQKDIEKEFNIKSSTVTVQIDRMVAKGLVQRCPSSTDKRIKKITLTNKGIDLSEDIKDIINENDNLILSMYTSQEKEVILKFLNDLSKMKWRKNDE